MSKNWQGLGERKEGGRVMKITSADVLFITEQQGQINSH